MRSSTSDELLDEEVRSSGFNDRVEVNAWRDGKLLAAHLDVQTFSISWDATRQVQGQAQFTFADPDGTLAPFSTEDALAPFGSRLQLSWVSGATGLQVPLGNWRIRTADPVEDWVIRSDADGEIAARPGGGGNITVTADEETATAVLDRLDAEAVPRGATCMSEIERLLDDIMPVTFHPSIRDRDVPATLVYEEGRMDAVEDHLNRLDAVARMSADGLSVIPAGVGTPVWTIRGGEGGVLIRSSRTMSDDGVYNAAVSKGESETQAPLVGRDYLLDGPLRWGGPYGRVPIFHQSIATTQRGVEQDAITLLRNRHATGSVPLDVACLLHPGLQMFDTVNLVPPSQGGDLWLPGVVTAMTMAGSSGMVSKRSSVRVDVSDDVLDALRGRARG